MLEPGLLHGLMSITESITDKSKCDHAAVAVTLGTEPLEPSGCPATKACNAARLSSVTSMPASRNSRPSLSSRVRPSRTAATFAVPIVVSRQRSCGAA
ncbi:MAG: hypothetical protein ABSF41_00605 [Pseudolabrys sp.]